VNGMEIKNSETDPVYCPLCKKDITADEFTQDSVVAGLIDLGYECTDCEIDVMKVYTRKF